MLATHLVSVVGEDLVSPSLGHVRDSDVDLEALLLRPLVGMQPNDSRDAHILHSSPELSLRAPSLSQSLESPLISASPLQQCSREHRPNFHSLDSFQG